MKIKEKILKEVRNSGWSPELDVGMSYVEQAIDLTLAEVGKKHLEDLGELFFNLQDDLVLDLKEGEQGYKSFEASYHAIKRNTLKVLKRKIFELKQKPRIEVLK